MTPVAEGCCVVGRVEGLASSHVMHAASLHPASAQLVSLWLR